MGSIHKPFAALLSVLLLVLATSALATDKPKKKVYVPNRPPPTEAELGFIRITRDELLSTVKRVGILPTRFPEGLEDRTDADTFLRESVTRFLTEAGFQVVGPETYQTAHDRFNRMLGGMYNPKTGTLKTEVSTTVKGNALGEFFERESLDAVVHLTVSTRTANYLGGIIRWDGVKEYGDTSGEGMLPALSLKFQIVTKEDRVVFGRHAGIQLLAYSVPDKGFDIPGVRTEDLLRDTVRLERATREATLPLRRSPRAILIGFNDPMINAEKINPKKLPPPPPARAPERPAPLKAPREEILGSIKRVLLIPVETPDFRVPKSAWSRLTDQLRTELANVGWELIESPEARAEMILRLLDVDLHDPYTGTRDDARLDSLRQSILQDMGKGKSVDAFLWLSVPRTTVLQRYGDVRWDGVSQNVFSRRNVEEKRWPFVGNAQAGSGTMRASTVVVTLYDTQGKLLYESRGGLELLQTLKITTPVTYGYIRAEPVDLAPGELFRDTVREKEAVHVALRDLIMTAEAIKAEDAKKQVDPRKRVVKKKKKKKVPKKTEPAMTEQATTAQ